MQPPIRSDLRGRLAIVIRPARILVPLVVIVVLALPALASAAFIPFTSPSRNIDCLGTTDAGQVGVSCVVQKASWPRYPPKPASCDVDWARSEISLYNGRVRVGACRGDVGPICVPGQSPGCRVLPYGASIALRAIRCTSRTNGITCRTRRGDGVGFRISREGYRIFR